MRHAIVSGRKQSASMDHPYYTFQRLGLAEKDGWTLSIRVGSLGGVQAQAWHADKGKDYRLPRFMD